MVDSFSKRQRTNNLIDISDRSKSYFAIVNNIHPTVAFFCSWLRV
jgi:hypothetical protein